MADQLQYTLLPGLGGKGGGVVTTNLPAKSLRLALKIHYEHKYNRLFQLPSPWLHPGGGRITLQLMTCILPHAKMQWSVTVSFLPKCLFLIPGCGRKKNIIASNWGKDYSNDYYDDYCYCSGY